MQTVKDINDVQIRSLHLDYDLYGYADASLLLTAGGTTVLCSITLINGVPQFLRGKGTGWLTASYAMLPVATQRRNQRESTGSTRNSRSVEISRLIGRSLRSIIDTGPLAERTIYVDCDVLQADGGTRVASITAANYALRVAVARWMKLGVIKKNILKDEIAALSVGLVENQVCVDLDAHNDGNAQADFNFVITRSGRVVEVQGTAEKGPIDWERFDEIKDAACKGVARVFDACDQFSYSLENERALRAISSRLNPNQRIHHLAPQNSKAPFFSLANRMKS